MTSNLLPSVAVLLFVGAMAWLAWLVRRQRHGAGGPASGAAARVLSAVAGGPQQRVGTGGGGRGGFRGCRACAVCGGGGAAAARGDGGGRARACAHMVGARCDGPAGQLPACAARAAAGKGQSKNQRLKHP